MKGYQISSGLALIVLSVFAMQTQYTNASYSMSETCKYYAKGYIADPDNCQGYGYCSGGQLIGTGECADDLLYNPATGACDYADKVQCMSKLESKCSVTADPTYVADPEDCTRACYCNNGTYTCVKCPDNQLFNPSTRACVWSKQYSCPANSICRLVPNNKFVGDPNNCGNYMQCVGGAGTSKECPDGLYYNATENMCISSNPCTGVPTSSPPAAGPGVLTNLKDNPSACTDGYKQPAVGADAYFVSDGQTCFGYYVCESASGDGKWFKCPKSTHFDESKQQCVTPYAVACTHDRCGNIDQNFVADIGCKSYTYCVTETKQSYGGGLCSSLNANYAWFDESQEACVNKDLAYAICTASSS
ncbi:peritrophin-44 isoform X2 [Haematobia irritans]|uniref:peritrophin-44 isoform X1 n=1 Tax=Haematobia irritans TaxID=7368 RepID=UPI003F503EB6